MSARGALQTSGEAGDMTVVRRYPVAVQDDARLSGSLLGKNENCRFSFCTLNRPLAVCTLLTLSFSALFADVSVQNTGITEFYYLRISFV